MTDRKILTQADLAPVSIRAWDDKYRLKIGGEPLDMTIEDTWKRVADAVAQAEAPTGGERLWAGEFYKAMEGFRFLPAGRIMAGAGTGRRVTLANCYVMGTIEDSLERIFHHLSEAAQTMQQGGGIGYDFSTLRPAGAPLVRTGSTASGPLPFMDTWDAMCKTIMSAGTRRGAMMGILRVDHPDIEAFIDAKRDGRRFRNFNLSVGITDEFMSAVENDIGFDLRFGKQALDGVPYGVVYRTVRARDLWDRIMQATYDVADPGLFFVDRCNQTHPLNYVDTIAAPNPCGEKPMAPYASCILGSINLAALIRRPFTTHACLDPNELTRLTAVAVRLLDDVIDVSGYPLPAQASRADAAREIGLGVTGLADALLMVGLRYGSEPAARQTGMWMQMIERAAYAASIDLAAEKGAFPLFDITKYTMGPAGATIINLPLVTQKKYEKTGLRNGLLLSIAPTGTISLMADNVSSGVEPIFAGSYTRKVLQPDGSRREERVVDHALKVWERLNPGIDATKLPYYVTAQDLSPAEHVRMQAAVQAHVDSAVSKTVNVPADISFEDFKDVYRLAWDSGCKGITTFRPNATTGSVLTADEAPGPSVADLKIGDKVVMPDGEEMVVVAQVTADGARWVEETEDEAPSATVDISQMDLAGQRPCEPGDHDFTKKQLPLHSWDEFVSVNQSPPPRAERLSGATYKLRWPGSEHAFYVTVNDVLEPDGARRPFEVFVNSADLESHAWVVALTRMVSAVFRRGGEVGFVAEELKRIHDPRGGHWEKGKYVPSLVAALGEILERHARGDAAPEERRPTKEAMDLMSRAPGMGIMGETCPRCLQIKVFAAEGCRTCLECGWSKCE